MKTRDYRDLIVWQRAMDLVGVSYQLAERLPRSERFGLTEQIRRAAASVPGNIAEGNTRRTRADYLRHLFIARASLAEVCSHVELACRLNYLLQPEDVREFHALSTKTHRMLYGLMKALKQ
ncbi:MAG: four helix bundle protein [Gemmatimonadaceae bacterium]